MLLYSRAAGLKMLDDFKKFIFAFGFATQIIYIAFLVYALIASAGNLIANIILLTLSVSYFIFYIIIHKNIEKISKKAKRKTAHIYNISRLVIKAYSLGVTLYGIHIATSHTSTLSVILAALTVIGWTLGVLFELVKIVFERYFDLMFTAIRTDIQPAVNLYNKLTRQDTEAPTEPTKTDIYLSGLASEYKKELDAKKAAREAARKAKKQRERQEKIKKIKSFFKIKTKKETSKTEVPVNNKNTRDAIKK